jgi:DNA-binding NarL/FixJ family response regulator
MTPRAGDAEPIEVVVVDDHPVVRSGLHAMFEAAGIRVVGEAGDGAEAIRVVAADQPDVVVMDLAMPGMSGIDATRRIVAETPHVAVLVVSMSSDEESVFAALRAGARGYVLKGSDPADLIRAVEAVARGGTLFGSELADRVLAFFTRLPVAPSVPFPELTEREREVLALLAKGLSNAVISARLGIQPKTVRNHVSNVLAKLAAADRTDAVLRAREAGLT